MEQKNVYLGTTSKDGLHRHVGQIHTALHVDLLLGKQETQHSNAVQSEHPEFQRQSFPLPNQFQRSPTRRNYNLSALTSYVVLYRAGKYPKEKQDSFFVESKLKT